MLTIPKECTDDIIAHSQQEDPNECCGILAGKNDNVAHVYRITNATPSPYRYVMEPQEMMNAMLDADANSWDFTAFYHSHTHSPAYPSPTDVRMAQDSGWLGEDIYYILISLEDKSAPLMRAFRIMESGEIVEQDFAVTG
ncbi:MAG: M67 family metallopeptidase [Chloroflexota bacterium]|nr:M67 family metallopeptidase [Chloroflexota bacterium]MDE2686642.1 M67 family metallopeptidase [Chloroflexota bacterium]